MFIGKIFLENVRAWVEAVKILIWDNAVVRGPCGERVKCFLLVHSNLWAICFEFALYLQITIEKPPINRLSSMTAEKTWPHIHVASAFSRISSIYGLLLAFSSRKRVFGFHARFFLKLNFSILLQPHRDRRTKSIFGWINNNGSVCTRMVAVDYWKKFFIAFPRRVKVSLLG